MIAGPERCAAAEGAGLPFEAPPNSGLELDIAGFALPNNPPEAGTDVELVVPNLNPEELGAGVGASEDLL